MDCFQIRADIDDSELTKEFIRYLDDGLSLSDDYCENMCFLRSLRGRIETLRNIINRYENGMADQRVAELERAIADGILEKVKEGSKPGGNAGRKLIFTTSEVMKLTGIKTKNAMIKYFSEGIIRANKESRSRRWVVKRADLAEYLGTDQF